MYCLPRAAQRPSAQRPVSSQRLREQRIGLRAALVGREVVRLVEVDRVDALDRDELGDLDHVGARLLQRLQLLGREDDVLVLGELVALDRVLARHDDAFLGADVLLLEARAARRLVQHVEGDRPGRLRRGVELDRNRHEAEGDRQRCDGSGRHDFTFRSCCCSSWRVPAQAGDRSRACSRLCLSRRAILPAIPRPFQALRSICKPKIKGMRLVPARPRSGASTPGPRAPPGASRRRSGSCRARSCCSR